MMLASQPASQPARSLPLPLLLVVDSLQVMWTNPPIVNGASPKADLPVGCYGAGTDGLDSGLAWPRPLPLAAVVAAGS